MKNVNEFVKEDMKICQGISFEFCLQFFEKPERKCKESESDQGSESDEL